MKKLTSNSHWDLAKKIAFRFFFIFFILFIIIENNGTYPFLSVIMTYPTELLHKIIPWVGKHILHLSYNITVFTNGSGDTTYDYVVVFVIASISVVGTVAWSLLDRKRTNYETLYYWLTVAVRFYVGLMLIQYGLVKVIKLQFPSPNIYRLTQYYGDSSPMGLAWTFLGFSKGYNLFMGLAEISAVLLLFRRTMTLGAIITLMTTTNVMAVNYFYDVPVKIVSTALVAMTLFLLLNDAKRLAKFFFTGEPVSLPVIKPPDIRKKWLKITKITFKILVIGNALIYGFVNVLASSKQYGDNAPKPKLYGLYDVDLFTVNNDTLPPLATDPVRWDQLVIEWEGYARVRHMEGNVSAFYTKLDTVSHKLDFTSRDDTTNKYSFDYTIPDPGRFNLTGIMGGDSVKISMTRKELKNFRLLNRGFHWINEYPFNR